MLLFFILPSSSFLLFFFNDTATTEIYTLSLHDALPISFDSTLPQTPIRSRSDLWALNTTLNDPDRKSTRLNSSHANISYAVFCLKKKKKKQTNKIKPNNKTRYTYKQMI